jgi:uncharacterized protein (TIGR00369 family)
MSLVGAEIDTICEGFVALSLARRSQVLQQHGFFHGGAIAFLIDNATTCAAGTLVERSTQSCLTAEYKLNFTSPANGVRIVCEAQVLKPGRSMSVVEAKVWSVSGSERKLCAVALATIAVVPALTTARPA